MRVKLAFEGGTATILGDSSDFKSMRGGVYAARYPVRGWAKEEAAALRCLRRKELITAWVPVYSACHRSSLRVQLYSRVGTCKLRIKHSIQ